MPRRSTGPIESRDHTRLTLPAMYTLIRVRPTGKARYCWTGHIYDISESGMRFELDAPLAPDTYIDVRAMLPGNQHTTVSLSGHIVRLHDDADERGPVRMGMTFDRFAHAADRQRLIGYLHTSGLKAA